MSDKPTLDDAIAYFQKCVDKGSSLGEVTTLAKLKEYRDSLQARPELPDVALLRRWAHCLSHLRGNHRAVTWHRGWCQIEVVQCECGRTFYNAIQRKPHP